MILVTTKGKVGAEAARLLAADQEPVRVLVRSAEAARPLADAGAEIAVGDLSDAATVDAAMRGVSTVILVSPAVPDQEIAVIDSAVRSGAGHVVKVTSKASADSSIARRRGQAEIESRLTASGLGYTLLRNNAYLQNFLMLAPAVAATDGFGSAAGNGRIGMVDTRDVAAVAARIAREPEIHRGRTYWLTGPDRLTYGDAAETLSRVLGRRITHRPLSFDEQVADLVAKGVPQPIATMNAQAMLLFAEGDSDWVTDDVPTLVGRPAISFERFAADHAAAFS